jgi:hypothetical protein
MAQTTTLAGLVAQGLDLADLTNSSSPVTARVEDYANAALAELHDLLVVSFEDYMLSRATIQLVAGTDAYSLPADFLKASKVYSLDGSERQRLKRFELDELDGLSDDASELPRYRILGNQIWLAPAPSATGSVELWYVPQFAKLTNATPGTTDVVHVSVPVGWEDFVVLSMAVRLRVREESDASQLLALKGQARDRILAAAAERDAGEPHHVADVSGRRIR